jgi:iron complex outermembrane receptor protein
VFKFAYVALASAAMSLVVSASAVGQEAAEAPAITSGGDVTADEATPLPPVIVESPAEPIVKKRKKGSFAASQAPVAEATAEPEDVAPGPGGGLTATSPVGVFTLGQLDSIGGSTITNEAMWTFNKQSLDQAASIVPGVTMHNTGGFT